MTDSRTITREQLLHLVDRARRGTILAAELDDLHSGIVAMAERLEARRTIIQSNVTKFRSWARRIRELEAENTTLRDGLAHCTHKARVTELDQQVAELTAGQCTHALAVCEQHHRVPVDGCPYPRCIAARARTTT